MINLTVEWSYHDKDMSENEEPACLYDTVTIGDDKLYDFLESLIMGWDEDESFNDWQSVKPDILVESFFKVFKFYPFDMDSENYEKFRMFPYPNNVTINDKVDLWDIFTDWRERLEIESDLNDDISVGEVSEPCYVRQIYKEVVEKLNG